MCLEEGLWIMASGVDCLTSINVFYGIVKPMKYYHEQICGSYYLHETNHVQWTPECLRSLVLCEGLYFTCGEWVPSQETKESKSNFNRQWRFKSSI